jgi:hypothetical protein
MSVGHTSLQIQAMVRDMDASMRKHKALKTSNPTEYTEKLKKDNETLFFDYPSIFSLHLQGKLDATFFEMLKLKRKIELGETTEDDASKFIGQKLFDRYVAPVINPNSSPAEKPLSYSEFYKQYQ